jgi:N-methylhydantoinase A
VSYRLGIDIGGTFTDFILADGSGQTRLFKVSSTPDTPAVALSEGLDAIATELGLETDEFVRSCDLIVHGTTVATNALIQRKGARTALLCTQGFRDSFEIRQGYKEERYDFTYAPPPMLVPRSLRRPVLERMTKEGDVYVELDEEQVREQIAFLRREGVEAVAVSFLWSFLNPAHEQRVGQILAEEFPGAFRSLSIDILPQIREYDRTSTTIVNAFVGPILERYIHQIESMFDDRIGANRNGTRIRFMQTNAGFSSGEALARRPVYALNSGPAAAPMAGLHFGRQLGYENIVTVDMGGTSFDVCLVENGLPDTVKNVDVCRYRLGIPMINIHTIGAGGGSIAWLDRGGVLNVGPQSAEAFPGPACYGRGGTEPTVTDANVVLGYFNPRALLAGKLAIDQAAAERAIEEKVARPADLSLAEAAHGIFEVVNHNMTMGIREVSVERGYDPREFAMVVGGGAGPVHAGRLAAELQVPVVIVPKIASAFCAFGEVVADLRHDYVSSYATPTPLREADLKRLNTLLEDMERRGRAELAQEGVGDGEVVITRSLEMRYQGQVHECSVLIGGGLIDEEGVDLIEELFHQKHEALYTYAERDEGICELINLLVTVRGTQPPLAQPELPVGTDDPAAALRDQRPVYFSEHGTFIDTPVYDGEHVRAGNVFTGPAVIEEPTTTIVVYPGSTVTLDPRGLYVMTFEGSTDNVR